jgi:excinuclease ABC subunit C
VGKAKNLKSRVSSYFQPPVRLGPKTAKLVSLIKTIEYIEVNSEIEALLLESRLIKKFKPQYNISSKDDKSPYYIHLTQEKYPKPIINHEAEGAIAGPFLGTLPARRILQSFRRVAPYCTAKRNTGRPCLYSHLGLCDPCTGNPQIDDEKYAKNILRLKRLLKGEFSHVLSGLRRQMEEASKNQEYETAASLRDKINSLELLLQRPVNPDEYLINPNLVSDKRQESLDALMTALNTEHKSLHRIEMYDISNLSGKDATGAMTVAIDGEVTPKFYRHFTIRSKDTPDDVTMMKEMLTRRLKRKDWPFPNLIVLDGGKSQLSIANSLDAKCPIFGLAKRDEIIFTQDGKEIKLDQDNPGLQLLQRLRDEAHRFSRKLHHKHRAKTVKS